MTTQTPFLKLNIISKEHIHNVETKTCTNCEQNLPLDNFRHMKNKRVSKRCIKCLDNAKIYAKVKREKIKKLEAVLYNDTDDKSINCTKCGKYQSTDNFRKKRNGETNKQCNNCLDNIRCEHDKQKNKCKECDGSEICEHNKIRSGCKDCVGGTLCKHKKARSRCRECGGGSFCEHDKIRSQCFQCGGSAMCEHGIQKYGCKDCGGKGICIHNKKKQLCTECNIEGTCEHKRIRDNCKECGGINICEHKKNKYRCRICTPPKKCEHGKEKQKCQICDPGGHLKSIVATRVRSSLLKNKVNKTLDYLGCDIYTYKLFLENKFEEGMSWDNYGEWEIDHIIPIKYNNPSLNDIIERLHYTNTQPLWKDKNMSKGNRYVG